MVIIVVCTKPTHCPRTNDRLLKWFIYNAVGVLCRLQARSLVPHTDISVTIVHSMYISRPRVRTANKPNTFRRFAFSIMRYRYYHYIRLNGLSRSNTAIADFFPFFSVIRHINLSSFLQCFCIILHYAVLPSSPRPIYSTVAPNICL